MHRPTIFCNNELCDAAAMDKMWRERLFSCWPFRVEHSTEDMRAVSDSVLFRKRLRLTFLVLLLTFVDYCCLLLMTLVMHLRFLCNRRTINFYDDDDDDDASSKSTYGCCTVADGDAGTYKDARPSNTLLPCSSVLDGLTLV